MTTLMRMSHTEKFLKARQALRAAEKACIVSLCWVFKHLLSLVVQCDNMLFRVDIIIISICEERMEAQRGQYLIYSHTDLKRLHWVLNLVRGPQFPGF